MFFNLFLNRIHIVKVKIPLVEKKPLRLVLLYLGTISTQTRTKLQKYIKGVLNCCKLQVILKIQNNFYNNSCFKDPVPKNLTSGMVYKFQCGEYEVPIRTERTPSDNEREIITPLYLFG